MINWEVSFSWDGSGRKIPLVIGKDGNAEPVLVHRGTETLMLVFDFFDRKLGRPLSQIELTFSWEGFAAHNGTKPERFLSVCGRKTADAAGRILVDIPLADKPQTMIFFRADVVHLGVGAYPDDFLDIDIPVKRR